MGDGNFETAADDDGWDRFSATFGVLPDQRDLLLSLSRDAPRKERFMMCMHALDSVRAAFNFSKHAWLEILTDSVGPADAERAYSLISSLFFANDKNLVSAVNAIAYFVAYSPCEAKVAHMALEETLSRVMLCEDDVPFLASIRCVEVLRRRAGLAIYDMIWEGTNDVVKAAAVYMLFCLQSQHMPAVLSPRWKAYIATEFAWRILERGKQMAASFCRRSLAVMNAGLRISHDNLEQELDAGMYARAFHALSAIMSGCSIQELRSAACRTLSCLIKCFRKSERVNLLVHTAQNLVSGQAIMGVVVDVIKDEILRGTDGESHGSDCTQACTLATSILDDAEDPLQQVDACTAALALIRGVALLRRSHNVCFAGVEQAKIACERVRHAVDDILKINKGATSDSFVKIRNSPSAAASSEGHPYTPRSHGEEESQVRLSLEAHLIKNAAAFALDALDS